jgi:hypothetical protein
MTTFNPSSIITTFVIGLLSLSGALADIVKLSQDDTITGTIRTLTDESIVMDSPLTQSAIEIKSKKVQQITFDTPKKNTPKHTEMLTLVNGDSLTCRVLSLDKKQLHISTWYAGEFTIPRASIQSLQFGISQDQLIYEASDPPSSWSTHEGQWTYSDHGYSCQGMGTLARKLDLPDNLRINFDLVWKETPNIILRFFAENTNGQKKQDCYEFSFNSAGIQIRRYLSNQKSIPLTNIDLKPHTIVGKKINVDLRINRTTGKVILSLDGVERGNWIDSLEIAKGNHIILNNRSTQDKGCQFKNLRISRWMGSNRLHNQEQSTPGKADILIDNEGEKITGSITSISSSHSKKTSSNRIVQFDVKYANKPLQIPDRRINTLVFAKTTNSKNPEKTNYTYKAKLWGGGSIQLQSLNLTDKKIKATHHLLGNITIDPAGITRIIASTSATTSPKTIKQKEKDLKNQEKQATIPHTPHSRILLVNGDRLHGSAQSINDQNELTWEAPSLRHPVTFPIKNILSLTLTNTPPKKNLNPLTRIKLQPRFRETNSDTILGELNELTPKNIKLKTWYGGVITIKRSMVQSLDIINNSPGYYFGPNNIQEWTLPEGKGSWRFDNGSLTALSDGGVGLDVGLREKSHISFDLSWKQSMRFRLHLYSSDISSSQPKVFYDVNFNRNYAFLRTYGKAKNGALRGMGGGRWQQIRMLPDTNRAHFDIYTNRKTGTFNIYIDGVRACLLQSQNPDPENMGTGISFVAEKNHPIELSSIIVTPWNGSSLPVPKKTLVDSDQTQDGETTSPKNPDDQGGEQLPPHKIILNNGDEVPGTVGKVQDGRMVIKTRYTPILIPINRIKSLNLGDRKEEPKKYAGDIRAWFRRGGHITLRLSSLKDGKITGFSQAFNEITLDLAAFNRIDFDIYDKKANQLRKNEAN